MTWHAPFTVLAFAVAPSLALAAPAFGWSDVRLTATATTTPVMVATAAYDRMTPAQRVGQLFMAGIPTTGASAAQVTAFRAQRVGNVILIGATSKSRTAVLGATKLLAAHLPEAGVEPFVSTDQEGGEVQRLTGHGFTRMPTALVQGRMSTSALRIAAKAWGMQLAGAGINLNLAPVADTVPAKHASHNQPIGQFDREFGHTPRVVAPHVVAFSKGMHAAGVATTLKHFPGLGRATGNTDTTPHVTDPTTRHDRFLKPFTDGIRAGAQFVMVSSATYPNIDAHHPACFSKPVITTMLRGDRHFAGVVISDDLGTAALSRFTLAARAVDFFTAGGTMLLDTSLGQIATMVNDVLAKANASPGFATLIKTAELNVLTAKATAHLIHS